MSGATGAGSSGTSAGTSTGSEADGGGRGSAARAMDTHTTQLKAIKPDATDAAVPAPEKPGPQGATVTDTRGPQAQKPASGGPAAAQPQPQPQAPAAASALPGERQSQQQAGPYHPPQAYAPAPEASSRKPRTGARTTPRTRKARLRVSKADPWSVMKVSFLLSIALGICTVVAAAVLWMVMNAMGVFSTVGATISEATGSNESNGFDLQAFLSLPNVLIFTTIIAVIDVVLATALATLGAFIYNLSAGFVGGVELTLAEDE
ncbi:DUF3566 domain-containing protein [Streptomyces caniscabiei]|uniref:DUF3566 domain-containing protein n=1 Tax=Streptomyces caniscabiei TaxID=2746961 RepID=A0A927QK70_9ACTN|nr:DUF3566 domain-containing protein [Streptomyces caniscabiei]MBD9724647.1 DUF3566 domain-containing protein [Streptomyces caniscabiei]MDX3508061.1 DUF3566 domain-containing protein [Streptomyces caniscabiei]MDX3718023.1 DUF3566 domain-containing protein [Streptomyces caniscabiei]WEO25742.1 DUF3566 domain-containing protein [Streptomyces caniscabiei]